MVSDVDEVARREKAARAAIKTSFGTDEAEDSVNLFVEHHLEQIEGEYWQKHLGTARPDPASVLGLLVLRKHWSGDDDEGIEIFDFTLPDETTNYVISVCFDDAGEIKEISMES